MKAIIGLGNPGKDYQRTRHNVGFMAIDQLSNMLNITVNKIKFKSVFTDFNYKGEKILLVKPQTYMNRSGEAVRELMNFYKLEPEDIIVIYDDVDIQFGDVRIRMKGSGGSHNGMKSIISQIQSDQFPRIRIGVGQKHEAQDLANFVLSAFSKEEIEDIDIATKNAGEAALTFASQGIDVAMNKYNIRKKD
ncbi:MAG: aminoacyl-tRNA hydrolase [Tissierellia bacterium]|nr:aminoacyl-tRNA hydrolase [Tissierellia bacterium]